MYLRGGKREDEGGAGIKHPAKARHFGCENAHPRRGPPTTEALPRAVLRSQNSTMNDTQMTLNCFCVCIVFLFKSFKRHGWIREFTSKGLAANTLANS